MANRLRSLNEGVTGMSTTTVDTDQFLQLTRQVMTLGMERDIYKVALVAIAQMADHTSMALVAKTALEQAEKRLSEIAK